MPLVTTRQRVSGFRKGLLSSPGFVLVAVWAASACASAPPRESFRFDSDLSASDAFVCVTSTLRRLGFEVVRSTPDERTVVALRHTRPTTDRPGEWWQITSTVTTVTASSSNANTGTESTSTVESVAGASSDREGPFSDPPAELAGVLGEVAARCQWPAQSPRG